MRFAITMFSLLAVASVIGTVLKQNEPYNNYIIKFGQFWFDIFEILGLYNVYQAFWFLLILIFLILSTSLCISRNTPKILKDYKNFQDRIREKSLLSFKHSYQFPIKKFNPNKIIKFLKGNNYKVKHKVISEEGDLIVAKKGDLQKLGYIFTHLAIVIISIGGLLDGNLVFKVQELMGVKQIQLLDQELSKIPLAGRMSENNLSYRASILLSEGDTKTAAILRAKEGYLVQEIPFSITLKDFNIEHYSTGQPKSFKSDLLVRDKKTGESITKTISVNKPLTYKGVTIYQAAFEDGGTQLDLLVWNLNSVLPPFQMSSEIFKNNTLSFEKQNLILEFKDFRKFNILEIGDNDEKKLKSKNVGPNFLYKVRNQSGQAKEYQTYQFPIMVDGHYFFMSGTRDTPQEEFKYLKIPADTNLSLEGFMIFKSLLNNPQKVSDAINKGLNESAFATNEKKEAFKSGTQNIINAFIKGGYSNLVDTMGLNIPEQATSIDKEKAVKTYINIIYLVGQELIKNYQDNNQDKIIFPTNNSPRFIQDALTAYSDSFFYGVPLYLELKDFKHVQASGLQLTKSPGQIWVYLGSILLVMGIFCMIYIQEIRLWIFIKNGSKSLIVSLATNRDRMDFDRYAIGLKEKIKKLTN
ncbi:cytochrome c biogenesis protein ResB [Methylophilaceae bacterium]|jgi:cytochrome c biogenesis protein|nr:cytochrome c biogenesis protein ResB [Methylophilaceae bacterium]